MTDKKSPDTTKKVVRKTTKKAPPRKRTTSDVKEKLAKKRAVVYQHKSTGRDLAFQPNLNNIIIERIGVAFETGHHASTAVKTAGITLNKFKKWMEQGQRDAEKYQLLADGGTKIKPKDLSQEFKLLQRVAASSFSFEDSLLTRINASESWQAQMALLRARFPDRWGDKKQVEVNATLTASHVFITPKEASESEWIEEQRKLKEGVKFIDVLEITGDDEPVTEGNEDL